MRYIGIVSSVALVLLGTIAGGCRVVSEEAPAGLLAARPVKLDVRRTWEIVRAGEPLGQVVELAADARDGQPAARCFSVRNTLGQELGRIDGLGRAWRHEPFTSEPAWVGSGTLAEGAAAILASDVPIELVELGAAR
ncbi:MAG: hypothetical protein FJ294_02350 [Planctomycetes bacterium]|nr:hypothetical protein [Planctomycetota bacterium]